MDKEYRINQLLEEISNDEKYDRCVFHGRGVYFVIGNGSLWEISDDASCSPKGGWFPDIVTGPTEEETKCLEEMMKSIGFGEEFFRETISAYGEFDSEYALEYFEENGDEESERLYIEMEKVVGSGKTPFETMDDFVSALSRYELDQDTLYYEWEGYYIDLYENICDTGEPRGTFDGMSDGDWIELLEDIDNYIVTA